MRAEIFRILTEKNLWAEDRASDLLDRFLAQSINIRLSNVTNICRDPDDNMFLECAALARAEYLVSGDKDLLGLGSYAGTRIITPFEYVNLQP